MYKNEKGITLIALIITIIIMLILVGVTISFVVNGGLITKAKQAVKQTQIEADKELLVFDVVLATNIDGSIDFNEFKEAAQSDGFTVSGSSLPCTATSRNGNEFSIGTDGKVTYTGEGEYIDSGSGSGSGSYDSGSGSGSGSYYDSDSGSDSSSDSDSGSDSGSEPAGQVDYNNNPVTLGSNVSVVPYENLTGGIKQGVDNGKVTAVLTEEINGVDTIAVIPTGFTVSSTSGENTISQGLVVRDSSNNEFVWIPVPNISQMAVETEANSGNYRGVLYDWDTDSTGQTAFSYSANSGNREPANLTGRIVINGQQVAYDSQEAFTEYGGGTYTASMYQTEFNNMVESVGKYKGFYVGRYETGGFNGSTIVVKAGETGTTDRTSANNSINYATWYKMYQMQKDFASGNSNVASTMIWGCQYDQVMKFVDDKQDGAGNTYDVTTYNQSRHTNSLAPTGNNTNDKVQNIYDLEGNVWEWTLEANEAGGNVVGGKVCRSGLYNSSDYSAVRYNDFPSASHDFYRKPCHTLHKVMLNAEITY